MEASHPHFAQRTPQYTHSLRLTFSYSGTEVRLAGVERVAVLAPAAVTPPPEGEQAGYWIEVRDSAGNLLYHRPLHDPIRADIEVFGDEPGGPIYRVSNEKREGEFDVLVPDLPEASAFVLYGTPAEARTAGTASKELLGHDFAELRRLDVNAPRENGEEDQS